MDRKQFEARIVARAWQDEKFREALRADPRGTLAAELEAIHSGAKLPENLEITVVEESADHLYLVIPNRPLTAAGALDDASLQAVAGGTGEIATTAVVTAMEPTVQVATLDVVAQVGAVVTVVAMNP